MFYIVDTKDAIRVFARDEQMKMRRVAVLTFLVLACLCHAGADDPLLSLANGWGRGTIIDFRETVYKNVPALANKEGAEAVEKWCLDLLGYPDLLEESGAQYWMEAKVSTIGFCIRNVMKVQHS